MKGKNLKYIIFLASISIAGIFLIQFVLLKKSYNISEKQFRESTSIALKEVAWQILLGGGNTSNFDSLTPVEIISGNYFLVNVGAAIDKELLKFHLTEQLKKHEVYTEFEFAIFDLESEQMEIGTLINTKQKESVSNFVFPTNPIYKNYFGIHFPNRSSFFNSQLSIWYFLTGLLVIVVLFFGYTLSVIIRQRQLSEVQKNFINNLTHELKTPISSIALSAKVLNDKNILKTPNRLFEYARIIQDQNKRLAKNVEKVLNLASLEKNRIRLNLKEVDLIAELKETVKQFEQTDFGQKAKIDLKPIELTVSILADKFHFSHLVLNILENAVKYCEMEPQIYIQLVHNNKYFELSIADNGIGIPKDQRKKIFTKFYRVPTGNVHNVKGFGLGLDYVQKIAIAHRWKIKVDENPRGGSIFTLSIPSKQ
jgi:two-component system phosphate regulon sensor histidine kinase PhoR